mmetsp:Transcript_13309/g.28261  ORF Transcript_13309/g.28261 Transcript_13309/m.28261 type:complete len:296 (-) Transcript_13309:418-1305(-)|eukprot:CAMPEP_0118946904 /NCGR_PEP_ID=MMETSP1169-20130426/45066_1 /TAXON_ID=36882 /ORGANISM="Pyramimonas obovata, Strain CCMP722" /LENGTH=295 /DNA_ID=CAMNT_0006893003 /DNA_START=154 /DNA_END=1041 /DNA_ORIENTATION=+
MPQAVVKYTDGQLLGIARSVIPKYFSTVDPIWVAAIAKVESEGDPYAYRYEAHIDDASTGLCQLLLKTTAQWLARDFPKYQKMGVPQTAEDLKHPEMSMYLCGAYMEFLLKHPQNTAKSLEWAFRAYNGDPGGADDDRPRHYGTKIKKALAALETVDPVPVDLSGFVTSDGTIIYSVLAGDTLASLAQKFNCSQADIRKLNPSADLSQLAAGLKVRLVDDHQSGSSSGEGSADIAETRCTHTVVAGDTMWKISRRYGVAMEEIAHWNPGMDMEVIHIGQQVIIMAAANQVHSNVE